MVDLKKRKLYKKVLYSKVTLAVLLVLVLLVGKAAWNAYGQLIYTEENLEKAQKELSEIKERKSLIEKETEELSSDEGIEKAIRERLPVAKPGEEVIIIVSDEESDTASSTQENLSWWESWWQKIF